MGEREQLREALGEAALRVLLDRGGFDSWWDEIDQGTREDIAREVGSSAAAVLDQQGWPDAGPARAEVRNLERQIVVMGVALDQAEAERDAALREAARYEQVGFATVPRDLHTHSAQHQERWIDHGCVPLYRQVTEGEEG